jgi:hypothetical protein
MKHDPAWRSVGYRRPMSLLSPADRRKVTNAPRRSDRLAAAFTIAVLTVAAASSIAAWVMRR